MDQAVGLGWATRAFHRPDPNGAEVGNLPRIEPDLETRIPSVHEPVPPRTTGPDTHARGTRTAPDHPPRPRREPARRTGPRQRRVREREQRWLTGTGQPRVRGTRPHLRIWPAHQIRNDQLTNDGNAGRESWLITSGCDEPAYPLCTQGAGHGDAAPPWTPGLTRPAGRDRGGCRPRTPAPMH